MQKLREKIVWKFSEKMRKICEKNMQIMQNKYRVNYKKKT